MAVVLTTCAFGASPFAGRACAGAAARTTTGAKRLITPIRQTLNGRVWISRPTSVLNF
jgi:hypothetical protein